MKKKYWYIILSIFLLIVVIVMVIAPGIAKNYAIKNSHELLGRQIDLHKFKVNYFTGTVRLVDFKMYEPDGKTVFVAFDTLLINTVPYRLLTNDLVIQQLYLKGLNTSVVQKDSVFNFDDLIAFYASESDTIEADTVESSSLNFEMSDFKLSEAKIKYNDLEVGKVHDLNDINLSIPYISWDQDASSEAGLRFNFRNEGYFQSSIKVDPNKGDFDAKLEISLLQLENFSDYLKKYIDVGSFSGLFNSKIQLAGNINQPENIIVSGLLNIADLKSTDLSDKQFLTIENLDCFVNKIDAGKMEFVFDSVILDKAYVCFDVNDSSNNIFDIVHYYEYFGEENEAVSSADKPENDTSASISYVVNNVRIKDGFVDFIDNMTSKTFEYRLSEISAFVDEINSSSSNIDEAGNIGLSLVLNDEARVSSSLKAEINFGDFDADVKVSNLKLGTFEDYARDYINIGSMDGVLGAEMNVRGNMYEPEKAIVSGWAGVEEFYLTDNNMWTIASIENMGFQINNVDAASMAFHFDSIFINRPYLYFEMMDSTNNIFDVFGYEPEYPEDTLAPVSRDSEVEAEIGYNYSIDFLQIEKGRIAFVDNTTDEAFIYPLSEIEMTADSITTDAAWVNTYAQMLLNDRGKLNAELGFNPANPMDFKLSYVLNDFLLSDLNIYSRFYMGFPILYGDMYYKSETEILQGQLQSENKLVIHNVELGDKTGGVYSLPLKFALFLLKDRDGVINLDVPVRGDLNDPKVRIGKIVWNTFKNLIIKVAASPVDFLSGMLSVDPKDISKIEFDYLDTTFTAYRQKQLDLLLELEQKKDGLEIEMVYFNDVEKEKEQIAIAESGKMFLNETGKEPMENEDEFVKFLYTKTQSDSLSVLDASLELIPAITLDSIAGVLAGKRKMMLEEYIMGKNDSSGIKTFIPNPGAPKNIGSKPVFEIKYSMK